jgi:hypothetical protein
MAAGLDYKRLRRLTTIYLIVQLFLVALLVYVAMLFQGGLAAEGNAQAFIRGGAMALVVQLILFYPILKLSSKEAQREIDSCATGLTAEQLKALRNKRLLGDVIKSAVFVFYATFLLSMPAKKALYWPVFFSFILTYLCYFQCVTFAIKRGIAGKS